ncbi:MAG TPA: PilN domain-containing protein [Candidatus Saccharimonadales bacterium]
MINLLPPEEKRQLQAARTNTLLIRYNILLLFVVAFMGVAVAVTYVYLSSSQQNAQQTIDTNNTKVGQYASVKAQAEAFRSNLATAKQILGNEVTYSKVILEMAKLIPSGVVLQNLALDSQTFGTETTLVAQAKSYENAIAFKDSFSKSPLFANVHFQSITSNNQGESYPITVNLTVTIKKEALQS